MPVEPYGIYLARFQFLDSNTYKIRPVVVVGQPKGPHKIVLAVPLSSKTNHEDIDVIVEDWQASGLAKPTVARVHRLTALLGGNILETLGQLDEQDVESLKRALRQALKL